MLVLAFDTSSPAVTVALGRVDPITVPPEFVPPEDGRFTFVGDAGGFGGGPRLIHEQVEVASNRQRELLAPLIDQVLREAGFAASDLGSIAVGLGPGPFTGLRVGIMTAKAMAQALDVPVYGECSLDLIAPNSTAYDYDEDVEHHLVRMSDARRKQIYWAEYSFEGARLHGPDLGTPADLADRLRGRVPFLAGAGALLYRDQFEGFHIIEGDPYPSAAELFQRVSLRAYQGKTGDDLTPLYLRRPDAHPPGRPKAVTPS